MQKDIKLFYIIFIVTALCVQRSQGQDPDYEYDEDEDEYYDEANEYYDDEDENYEEDDEYYDDEYYYDDDSDENECPRNDDPSKVVFIPNVRSCSEYFLCYHGASIPMQCINGLHFNVVTKTCDFPRNANCRVDIPTIPKCDGTISMEVYPHPTQCDYYYYCRKGYLSIQQCPFYYYFDVITKMCRYRDGYQC